MRCNETPFEGQVEVTLVPRSPESWGMWSSHAHTHPRFHPWTLASARPRNPPLSSALGPTHPHHSRLLPNPAAPPLEHSDPLSHCLCFSKVTLSQSSKPICEKGRPRKAPRPPGDTCALHLVPSDLGFKPQASSHRVTSWPQFSLRAAFSFHRILKWVHLTGGS